MKTLNSYILKEITKTFLIGLVLFLSMLFISVILYILNMLFAQKIPPEKVLKLVILINLTLIGLAIPMSFLFSISTTYLRMKDDNEITSLKATGIRVTSYVLQPFVISILLSLFLYYHNFEIGPRLESIYYKTYRDALKQRPLNIFFENSFTKIKDYNIYISKIDRKNNNAKSIKIYQLRLDDTILSVSASNGKLILEPEGNKLLFRLFNGTLNCIDLKSPHHFTRFKFKQYVFSIPVESNVVECKNLKELTRKELIDAIKRYTAVNISVSAFLKEYTIRNILSFTPFVLCLISLPLAMKLKSIGRYSGFALSLILIFIYYILFIGSLAIAGDDANLIRTVPWCPNILFTLIGLWLTFRLIKE